MKKIFMPFELHYKGLVNFVYDLVALFLSGFLFTLCIWPIRIMWSIYTNSRWKGAKTPLTWLWIASLAVWIATTFNIGTDIVNIIPIPAAATSIFSHTSDAFNNIRADLSPFFTLDNSVLNASTSKLAGSMYFAVTMIMVEFGLVIYSLIYGITNCGLALLIFVILSVVSALLYMNESTLYKPGALIRESATRWFIDSVLNPIKMSTYTVLHAITCLIYALVPIINIIVYNLLLENNRKYTFPLWSLDNKGWR